MSKMHYVYNNIQLLLPTSHPQAHEPMHTKLGDMLSIARCRRASEIKSMSLSLVYYNWLKVTTLRRKVAVGVIGTRLCRRSCPNTLITFSRSSFATIINNCQHGRVIEEKWRTAYICTNAFLLVERYTPISPPLSQHGCNDHFYSYFSLSFERFVTNVFLNDQEWLKLGVPLICRRK